MKAAYFFVYTDSRSNWYPKSISRQEIAHLLRMGRSRDWANIEVTDEGFVVGAMRIYRTNS